MATQTLQDAQIADLILSTRPDEGRGRFQQIAQRLTDYTVMNRFMKEEKQEFQSGTGIQGNLLLNHSFAFSMVGLHQVIEPSIPSLMGKFEVPWRHFNYYSAWERRELLMNRSKSALFKLMESRRVGAAISAFEGLEAQFWAATVSDTTNDIYPLFYWLPKATAGQTLGFNGQNPTGFSNCGGIDASLDVNSRWRSMNGIYEEVSEDDSLDLMSQVYRKTKFKSPVTHEDYTSGRAMDNRIYMNEATIRANEKEMRSRNDNHTDLGMYLDATAFKRLPLEYVDKLDEHDDDPICFINWQTLAFVWLEGDYLHEHDPATQANQPNTWVAHTDGTCNTCCVDRRRNAILNKAS